jgi:hypothetical protein
LKNFRRFTSNDPDTQKLIDNLIVAFKPLIDVPLLDGILLEGIELSNGVPKIINHKLNRKYRGWFVVRKNTNADVWETSPSDKRDNIYIILNSSADTKIDIWIF